MLKKRILFRITPADKSIIKQLIPIITNIDDNTFDTSLLLSYKDKNLQQEIPADIDVIFLVNTKSTMSQKSIFSFFQAVSTFLQLQFYRFFPSRIQNKIRKFPDIEVAFNPGSVKSLLKSPFKESKKIFWLHTDVRKDYTQDYCRGLARMMYCCCVTVFSSFYFKKVFESYLGVKLPGSICIHPYINGHDILKKSSERVLGIEKFSESKEKVFVSAGDFTFQNGYDILIAAHAELLLENYHHKIVLIGDGEGYEKLRDMIEYMRLEDSFHILKGCDNPYPYIQMADYYIQPSRYEPYPFILGEVVVLNKPIISTAAGSVGELLGQWKTAYLIEFDVHEIKEAMKKFLCNESLVAAIAEEQQKFDFWTYNKTICNQVTALFSTI